MAIVAAWHPRPNHIFHILPDGGCLQCTYTHNRQSRPTSFSLQLHNFCFTKLKRIERESRDFACEPYNSDTAAIALNLIKVLYFCQFILFRFFCRCSVSRKGNNTIDRFLCAFFVLVATVFTCFRSLPRILAITTWQQHSFRTSFLLVLFIVRLNRLISSINKDIQNNNKHTHTRKICRLSKIISIQKLSLFIC